ncbi:MAG: hypothetical protein NDI93_18465, partial [Pseudomonas sp.]|nr:hypothetical protein [Pseudomonas sp.]
SEPAVPVRVGAALGLEEDVRPALVERPSLEPGSDLELREDRAQDEAPGGRERHGADDEAPEADLLDRPPDGAVAGEVLLGEEAPLGPHEVDDPPRDVPVVERVGPVRRDPREGGGEVGLAEERSRRERRAAGEEDAARLGPPGQELPLPGEVGGEARRNGEALAREALGRSDDTAPGQPPETAVGLAVAPDRPGYGDGEGGRGRGVRARPGKT